MRRVLRLGWRFLTVSLINSLSLLAAILLTPGITIRNTPADLAAAVGFALLIGLANAFVRPVLIYLTYPVNLLTIGIPTILIDAGFILVMAKTWAGFQIANYWPSALIGAVILPTANIVLHTLTDPGRQRTLYGAVLRRLGRSRPADGPPLARRGVIFVQIDGLSYVALRNALRAGVVPVIEELLEGEAHRMLAWDCGIPSQTSSVQAGIMYGDNFDIPAFRWYDRELGRIIVSNHPDGARTIDRRAGAGRRGLLENGSSVSNLLQGQAHTSILTVSEIGDGQPSARWEDLLLFLLNPYCMLRVVGQSLWDMLAEQAGAWRQRLRKEGTQVSRRGLYPFFRVMSNIVMREISTYMVLLDIMRGAPAIYVTYLGYDEVAHFAGPHSSDTHGPLAGIDSQIRHIQKIMRRDAPIPYDLIVLSDHGHTLSIPFTQVSESSLQGLVSDLVSGDLAVAGDLDEPDIPGPLLALLAELREVEQLTAGRLASRSISRGRRALERYGDMDRGAAHDPAQESAAPAADEADVRPEALVLCSGSVAHLYFGRRATPRTLEQVEQAHPLLVAQLVGHAGIGFVAGRSELRGPLVIGSEGFRQLESGVVVGVDPLEFFGDPRQVAAQVLRLITFPNTGDLVVHGRYRDGRVITFEEHVGSHGGVGGAQTQPFLIYPAKMSIDATTISNATDLYPLFQALRDAEESPPAYDEGSGSASNSEMAVRKSSMR
jgi:uncharacterized membrane protein YvlD (DUF360 family)